MHEREEGGKHQQKLRLRRRARERHQGRDAALRAPQRQHRLDQGDEAGEDQREMPELDDHPVGAAWRCELSPAHSPSVPTIQLLIRACDRSARLTGSGDRCCCGWAGCKRCADLPWQLVDLAAVTREPWRAGARSSLRRRRHGDRHAFAVDGGWLAQEVESGSEKFPKKKLAITQHEGAVRLPSD